MHEASKAGMKLNLNKYCSEFFDEEIVVADIGSRNKQGRGNSYKDKMPTIWKYLGLDLNPGRNVDVIMPGEYEIPLETESVDLVISGQCLEHVNNPFKLVTEAARILKPGGLMILVAPFIFVEHKHPVDTFRYLPDGMRSLFKEAGLETLDAYTTPSEIHRITKLPQEDCWGIAKKP
jgi:SAM-dependent methyltransferase